MSKRESWRPSPAATIVTMLSHHLFAGRAARFPYIRSAILRRASRRRRSHAQEKHDRHPRLPFCFLHDNYALSRPLGSDKLLKVKSARQGRAIDAGFRSTSLGTAVMSSKVAEQNGRIRQSRVRPLRQPVAARMIIAAIALARGRAYCLFTQLLS